MTLRENWRLIALVILVTISLMAIFAPGFTLADDPVGVEESEEQDRDFIEEYTNLQFGLDLSGGTTVRAPLTGVTAEEVDVTRDNRGDIESSIADEIDGVDDTRVQADPELNTVEVLVDVEPEEVEQALDRAEIGYEEVRMGVTEPTRDRAVSILETKVDEAGLSGSSVYQAESATSDEHFIVVEVPNQDQDDVRELIASEGRVELVAEYPLEDDEGNSSQEKEVVLSEEHIDRVGQAQDGSNGQGSPNVPLILTDEGAERFASIMMDNGFTSEGISACSGDPDEPGQYCLHTQLDDEIVHSAGMSEGLAETIESGEFEQTGDFIITTTSFSEAQQLQIHLEAGAMPSELALDRGTINFVSPSLAENFKFFSLVTGLIAVLAVVTAVTIRYRDPRVSAPMVVTAMSEVLILVGIIAFMGIPLDLAHIAGLIAAIGTGVDDLIIIGDGIMKKEGVSSDRVFDDRFHKAFWIITVAAITTIVAMSPLAFLSLGDLTGFAIITILGVILGVTITRPAYGDILRHLVLK